MLDGKIFQWNSNRSCLNLSEEALKDRIIDVIDIVKDNVADNHYKESEDLRNFKSVKTKRGPLTDDWMETSDPIMCSYKNVEVKLDIWGLQGRIENYIQNAIREILLVGHKQAFAWIDDWYGMTESEVRDYESIMQSETNDKVKCSAPTTPTTLSDPDTPGSASSQKSWFSWS
uniref:Phosphatidylinositol transfer protein N-terminal domain-containing protein n=1 Tax=Lepeophtheirus salmonis TaxID=72036 RepID=A0A0K2VJ59_LEPSM